MRNVTKYLLTRHEILFIRRNIRLDKTLIIITNTIVRLFRCFELCTQ